MNNNNLQKNKITAEFTFRVRAITNPDYTIIFKIFKINAVHRNTSAQDQALESGKYSL